MDEHFELALSFLGRAYLRKGDPERALAHFTRRRFQIKGAAADLVEAYAFAGREPEARAQLEQMHAMAKSRYMSAYEFATMRTQSCASTMPRSSGSSERSKNMLRKLGTCRPTPHSTPCTKIRDSSSWSDGRELR